MPPGTLAPRVYTLLPGPDPSDGGRPPFHAPNPNLSWVTAVLVVLCIVSLTLALATIYAFSSLRHRDAWAAGEPVAGGGSRTVGRGWRVPRLVDGVAVRQPSGSLVAGVPECAV